MTTHYELSDVEVDTLGLVSHGANKEEFFLLKSDSGSTEESVLTESVWRRIAATIRKAFSFEAEPATDPVNEEVAKDEPATEPTEPIISEPAADLTKSPAEQPPALETEPAAEVVTTKRSNAMSDEISPAVPTESFVSKADHDAVVQEVALLKSELAKAQEEKERAVYLTKAQTYTSLPVSPSELADHLYWLAKTDADRYTWFESVIKALDNTMHDASIFVEKGTSAPVENDAISAALKSADPRAALLSLDRNTANAYLQAVRKVN